MRFENLRMIATGPFTNFELDLSGGTFGLHVVYGSNEAGKSSSLRAITNFLFGFPSRTSDDFIHPYSKLRIGAKLTHSDGSVLDCVRRKANQNSLRDHDDVNLVDDSELTRMLGDLDRELFSAMLGIDHPTLRAGGDEIARGGGRVGEMLFAAGAGLANLVAVQKELQNKEELLFKSSGRSGQLISKFRELAACRQELRKTQVQVEDWRTLQSSLDDAKAKLVELDAEAVHKNAMKERLRRIFEAIPLVAQWRKTEEGLLPLRDVPLLPDGFATTSEQAVNAQRSASLKRDIAIKELKDVQEKLAKTQVDDALLSVGETIDALNVRLGRYRKDVDDLAALKQRLANGEHQVREVLRKLGKPIDTLAIEALRIPNDKVVRIQTMATQYEGLIANRDSAERDVRRLQLAIEQSEEKLRSIEVTIRPELLESARSRAQRDGDLDQIYADRIKELSQLEAAAQIKCEQLPMWRGTLSELVRMAVPSEATIDRFKNEIEDAQAEVARLKKQRDAAHQKCKKLQRDLLDIDKAQKIPTLNELNESRIHRDRGLQLLLRRIAGDSIDSSELESFCSEDANGLTLEQSVLKSVRNADTISDLLREHADRVATKEKLTADLSESEAECASLDESLDVAERKTDDVVAEWNSHWDAIGIVPQTPREMMEWRRAQQALVKDQLAIDKVKVALADCSEKLKGHRQELSRAMLDSGLSLDTDQMTLRSMIEHVNARIRGIDKNETLRDRLQQDIDGDRRELLQSQQVLAQATESIDEWTAEWRLEMNRIGLEENALPAQATAVLGDLNVLFNLHGENKVTNSRIKGLERDNAAYSEEIAALESRLGRDRAGCSLEEVVTTLNNELQEARSAKRQYASYAGQIASHEKTIEENEREIAHRNIELAEFCRIAKCGSHEDLSQVARLSQSRQQLEGNRKLLEDQILSRCAGASMLDFVADVDTHAVEADSIPAKIADLENQLKLLQNSRDNAVKSIYDFEEQLRRMDGGSNAAEIDLQCESIAASIEEDVRELMTVRIASAVLNAGIERHRSRNQGPVMRRASELFHKMTCERYSGLRIDLNDRNDTVLVGVRALNEEVVHVEGMSDGTCDQLYLALRLASLENWLEHHEPVPFIVDDVLMNFDDARSAATLQALGELSSKTQVIFFTHHQHMVDLARSSLGADVLFVHQLSS